MFPSATELAADLDAIIADMPHTMTWGVQTISVSLDDIIKADMPQLAGVFSGRDVGVYCKLASFSGSTPPEPGVTVVIDSVTYRLTGSRVGPDGVGWQGSLQRASA